MYFNCYSKVTVKFAEPVLNETKAKILQTFGTTAISQATQYCQNVSLVFWLSQCKKFGKASKENQAISETVY